jgi:XTP/dITP diphosphohydrolase
MMLHVASGNADKLAEISARLGGHWRLKGLREFGLEPPEETGSTLAENALLKARILHRAVGGLCLADDTGLLVDALGGAPGVRSARWAGEGCSYADNVAKLCREIAPVPEEQRGACFETVLALVGKGLEILLQGSCRGRILDTPRGRGGFGYDPVFYLPELGRTFAEMSLAEKNRVSHRGRALDALASWLDEHAGRAAQAAAG